MIKFTLGDSYSFIVSPATMFCGHCIHSGASQYNWWAPERCFSLKTFKQKTSKVRCQTKRELNSNRVAPNCHLVNESGKLTRKTEYRPVPGLNFLSLGLIKACSLRAPLPDGTVTKWYYFRTKKVRKFLVETTWKEEQIPTWWAPLLRPPQRP